ncbi:MAG: pentapeptide repeat-containing protein [Microcystaceae cyanobacterium]
MANSEQVAMLKRSVEEWNQWRQRSFIQFDQSKPSIQNMITHISRNAHGFNLDLAFDLNIDLTNADLSYTDLNHANLSCVNLTGANLSYANLHCVNCHQAQIIKANLSNANLHFAMLNGANLRESNLSNANLNNAFLCSASCSKSNFSHTNLRHAKLDNANCKDANFNCANLNYAQLLEASLINANLSYTTLSKANLKRCKAIKANFEYATLTGACIQDWHINNQTKLKHIICDYIYLKNVTKSYGYFDFVPSQRQHKLGWLEHKYAERRPSDGSKIFNQGDFQRLIETLKETVDLIFSQGIDWQIFLNSFHQIQQDFTEENIAVSGIEKKSEGAFVIKLEVPQSMDKAIIEASFGQHYQPLLEAKDAQIKSLESEVESRRRENTRMLKIIETLAEKDSNTYNFQGSQFGGGFAGNDYQGDVKH